MGWTAPSQKAMLQPLAWPLPKRVAVRVARRVLHGRLDDAAGRVVARGAVNVVVVADVHVLVVAAVPAVEIIIRAKVLFAQHVGMACAVGHVGDADAAPQVGVSRGRRRAPDGAAAGNRQVRPRTGLVPACRLSQVRRSVEVEIGLLVSGQAA